MIDNPTILQVSDGEIGSMRHRLNLLRAQLQSGKVEPEFLDKHITQMSDLLERLEQEHRQLKRQRQLEALYNVSRLVHDGAADPLMIVVELFADLAVMFSHLLNLFGFMGSDD